MNQTEQTMNQTEQYDVFEISFENADTENPVIEHAAVFEHGGKEYPADAFRKEDGVYAVRFMPMEQGTWNYRICVDGAGMDSSVERNMQGTFECVANTHGNHGPVHTQGDGFRYADGSRYLPFGTTCYAWIHQSQELQEETLRTLAESPFNKIRMCVFPKSMPYNNNAPDVYPFRKREDGSWNVWDPDPVFWEKLDTRLAQLRDLGIEADLIVFHPYDRWGFAELSQEESLVYLRYCIARLSAYSNLWWSLANEYEMVYAKSMKDWEEYGEMLLEKDIYGHLRSVHNIFLPFPKKPWLTHCSVQSVDIGHIPIWKKEYGMPVVIDECGYEGNIEYGWGNLTGMEMVHRFWWTIFRGGYCTHGETFHREDEVLWWAKGGKLYGESAPRIAFLRELLESLPGEWKPIHLNPTNPNLDLNDPEAVENERKFQKALSAMPESVKEGVMLGLNTPLQLESEKFLMKYLERMRPCMAHLDLPKEGKWTVEVIDTWEMTRTVALRGVSGKVKVDLPSKEGIALLALKED